MAKISAGALLITLGTLLTISVSLACGTGGQPTVDPIVNPSPTPSRTEDVKFTIGNLTDKTGASANAIAVINQALDDIVEYFNEENLIPGVHLNVISYDGMLDPGQDVTGYEWLLAKGADIIYTSVPTSPVTLNSRVNKDKVVLFTPSIPLRELSPPGYVFDLGNVPEHDAFTLLKWIAANDWDYQTNGPARIGGAGWTDSYNVEFQNAMKKYAQAHPEQFDFIGGFATEFGFLWKSEIEALKDADYVFPPSVPTSFIEQYRDAGNDAKFICAETQAAFTDLIDDARLWEEIDGALFIRASRWWNETGPMIDFTNRILDETHSASRAQEIRNMGSGYLSLGTSLYTMLEIIRQAAETVGPDNLNSQAIYDSAQLYSFTADGLPLLDFTETKRYLMNYRLVYRADATEEDLVPISENWLPVVVEP